jgi:hypothetical protein
LSKQYKVSAALIALVILSIAVTASPISPIPEPHAKFSISTWTYPDQYGQGIFAVSFWGNSSGSWENIVGFNNVTTPNSFVWNASVGMTILVVNTYNWTLNDINSTAAAEAYTRNDILIVDQFGTTTFSQQNLTLYTCFFEGAEYYGGTRYFVEYNVTLPFLPLDGYTYAVTIGLDIWY